MSKREVRREALDARRSLAAEQVELLSARVQETVIALPEFSVARVIAGYVAKSDEVQTKGILKSALALGKRVLVPRSDPASLRLSFYQVESLDGLVPRSFGVLEPPADAKPVPLNESQLVLVPVVAWDDRGQRLGYGKGFFDRELRHRGAAASAGLAFESQRRDPLPATSSDVSLDMLVTEKRVLRFGRGVND